MGPIKLLGLVTLAALGAMAFVGVTSTMAKSTALCSESSGALSCPAEKQIAHVHFNAQAAELLTPDIVIQCDIAILGEANGSPLGSPLVIKGSLTHSNCTGLCTVLEESEAALMYMLKTGTESTEVTFEYEVRMTCGIVINCLYNGEGLVAHGLGPLVTGDNGQLVFEEAPVKKTGGAGLVCPSEASLDAQFVAQPGPLYIRS